MELRPYQRELVDAIDAKFSAGANALCLQLGTGGGKTATASELLRRSTAAGRRSIFLAHLDALVDDTHKRLTAAGVDAGFIQSGRPSKPDAPVQVCSIATVHARGLILEADDVILDECHRAQAPIVRAIQEAMPRARKLGLTATPQRGDGQPLGDTYQDIVCGPTNRWLTDHGYLVPCDVLSPDHVIEKGLCAHPVARYQEFGNRRPAMVFATNVAHAKQLVTEFIAAGYPAEAITGTTARKERIAIRARMDRGETLVLVGVGVFIEGWDQPSIEHIFLARMLSVTGSYLQSIGRGLRPSPETGKTRCTVHDLRGSFHLHGLPDDEHVWSLTGDAVRRKESMTPVRRCGACGAMYKPASRCPRCGASVASSTVVPKILTRAERMHNMSRIPQWKRDEMYLRQLESVAAKRLRFFGDRVKNWALTKFVQKFNRLPMKKDVAA